MSCVSKDDDEAADDGNDDEYDGREDRRPRKLVESRAPSMRRWYPLSGVGAGRDGGEVEGMVVITNDVVPGFKRLR